jgi:prevent-host-death family protein
MTATQAKTQLLAVLDEVQGGETLEITRHGRVIARLVPASGSHALRARHAGLVVSNADDVELFSTGAEWDLG